MTFAIELPLKTLQAISLFAAKKDPRYYLEGVSVSSDADGVTLVATDGHILGAWHIPAKYLGEYPQADFIIPAWLISAASKVCKGFVTIALDGDTCTVGGVSGTIVDGKFPDYRRAIAMAKAPTGEAADYDPESLIVFTKAAKLLGRKHGDFAMRQNGPTNPALIGIKDMPAFVGVIMPRKSKHEPTMPAWALPKEMAAAA